MGSSGSGYHAAKTPPEPETVKYTEAEVAKSRSEAKAATARRYGIAGTNVTQGKLGGVLPDTKQAKLGGS